MRRTALATVYFVAQSLLFFIWLPIISHAQVATDSSRLRAIFGPPIRKNAISYTEAFTVRRGIEAIATYSAGNDNLCKFEIPSGVATTQQADQVLDLVAPVSVRGDKWNEMTEFTGFGGVNERLL